MIKFCVAGSLNYMEKIDYLIMNGYTPELIISDDNVMAYREIISKKKIELLVCFAYPHILSEEEIALFKEGCINYHSGLPKYRGRHPLNWMLIDGVKIIPNAIHFMNKGIDTGDIIIEKDIAVEREDDYASISKKQTVISQELMVEAIRLIEDGKITRKKQNKAELSYTKMRIPDDSKIDWNKASLDVHHFISALVDPMPNAFGICSQGKVEIKRSIVGHDCGLVLGSLGDNRYVISTGDGVVLVITDKELTVGDRLL